MLKYNLSRIFAIRNINKPTAFFINQGLSLGTASKYAHSAMTTLNLRTVENICNLLNCTPNDLVEWVPDKPEDDRPDHPLRSLKKPDKPPQITQLVHSLSVNQINQLEEIIKDIKAKNHN